MMSPLPQQTLLTGRMASLSTRGARRRPRRLSPAVLEALESRTLLTLSATIVGTTSTFSDLIAPLGGTLQVPSPTTPIDANLTNNQFESGNVAFTDAFDFDSVAPGSNPLPTAVGSTVALSVAGNAADYTFHIGPSASPLLAGFQFFGGAQNNTMILDYTDGDPLLGGSGVSFSAPTGTNVLRVIDPAGTYTTATYDVAAHSFTFGGLTILVSAANLTLDLSGTKITSLDVILPDVDNQLVLSRETAAPAAPDRMSIISGLETNTLLYPSTTSPVTLTGGALTNSLTVDLINGNPLPPDTGPLSGLVLTTVAPTTVAFQNGTVTTAVLDLGANTLALDGGLIRYPTLTPVDLTTITVVNASLKYSATHHAATLELVATGANPYRFYEAPNVTLLTLAPNTKTASVTGFTGVANTLTVDYTNGNPIPRGGLTFDGAASGTLTVTGTGPNAALQSAAYTASAAGAGRLVIDNGTTAVPNLGTIQFTGLSPLFVTTPSIGTVSVDITAAVTSTTVTATVDAVPVVPPTPPQDSVTLNLGLESVTFTHPTNLILGGTGGDASNTYRYTINGFSNNVTVNGNAGTLEVHVLRNPAGDPNTGTLKVVGGSGAATLNLDTTRGDPIPAAGGVTFQGGTASNTLAVVNPPTPNPLTTTTIRLHGPSPANWIELDLGGGKLNAYGLNQAIDLTAGVTTILSVLFADTTNAIGLATIPAASQISINAAPLVKFDPTKTTDVRLTGGTADDSLTVDFATANPLPTDFRFDGGAGLGVNSLTVRNAVITAAAVNVAAQTVVLDTKTIRLTNVPTIDLAGTGTTVAALTLDLPAAPASVTLSRAFSGGPAKLAYGAGNVLLYPIVTNPVTLKGGATTNALTVDLGNGNPVPPGTDPTRGLFVDLTGVTNFSVVNGLATLVRLDVAAKTLAIDTGLVRFTTLPAIDLAGASVSTVELLLAGNATLSKATAPGLPLQIALAGGPTLTFASSTPFVTVNGAAGLNVLTVDSTNGIPLPTAQLSFYATAGAQDVLVVSHTAIGSAVYTVGGAGTNELLLDARRVVLLNPSKVSIDATSTLANLTVNLANVANTVALNAETVGGLNRIGLGVADLIAFVTPTVAATVNGGNQADTYQLAAGFAAPLVVNDRTGVANNALFIDFTGVGAAAPLPQHVAFNGTGSDTFAAIGPVQTVLYTATGPHAGTVAFDTTTQLTFTGLLDFTTGINLAGLTGFKTLTVSVTDGVAHTYDVNAGSVKIDQGLASVMFPITGTVLALAAGQGVDLFRVGLLDLPQAGYSIDGRGGDDQIVIESGSTNLIERAADPAGRTGSIADINQQHFLYLVGAGVPNVSGRSFRVTNNHDTGLGSLRASILNSNTFPGNTIDSDARYTITPLTPLPAFTQSMTLAGGWMTLDGQNAIANGLQVDSGASGATIQGITLIHFGNAGLFLNNASRLTIDGIVSYSNGVGVLIQGAGTTTGGGNTLRSSFIGYNPNSTASQAIPSPFGNVGNGVVIVGSTSNIIQKNTVSGNGLAGVAVVDSRAATGSASPAPNRIVDNTLGLTPNGQNQAGNLHGVYVDNSNNTTIQNNLIGGNGRYGVYLLQSSGIDVRGNTVGDAGTARQNGDGSFALGNFGDGIYVSDSPNVLIASNIIVGNAYPVHKKDQIFRNPPFPHPNARRTFRQSFLGNGIHLSGRKTRGTRIVANRIGLTASGLSRPNQAFAILIDSGARFRSITPDNQFRTNPAYAPETRIFDATRLRLKV